MNANDMAIDGQDDMHHPTGAPMGASWGVSGHPSPFGAASNFPHYSSSNGPFGTPASSSSPFTSPSTIATDPFGVGEHCTNPFNVDLSQQHPFGVHNLQHFQMPRFVETQLEPIKRKRKFEREHAEKDFSDGESSPSEREEVKVVSKRMRLMKPFCKPEDFEDPNSFISIKVKTLTGRLITVKVSVHNTIEELKEHLEEKSGIPMYQQRLIYKVPHLFSSLCGVCVCVHMAT